MSSQLEKSSIIGLLQTGETQHAEGCVRSVAFKEEMSLIGFIPFSMSMFVNLNEALIVTPYFIRFAQSNTQIPIYDTIKPAVGKQYKLDEKFIIDICLETNDNSFWHSQLKNGEELKNLVFKNRIPNFLKESFERKDDTFYYYTGREGEWVLSGEYCKKTVIIQDFLCLCSYMNKVTGTPCYTLLPSRDTIRVLPEKDDNIPL